MITSRSRYRTYGVQLLATPGAVDPKPTLVPPSEVEKVVNFSYYVWRQGDRIDLLAYLLLGDDTSWWMIADANPEILAWADVPYGTVIRIPDA